MATAAVACCTSLEKNAGVHVPRTGFRRHQRLELWRLREFAESQRCCHLCPGDIAALSYDR
eukprot:COSAG02_NODE_63233_length_263_cov_1.579268_1_plen_60_part_10